MNALYAALGSALLLHSTAAAQTPQSDTPTSQLDAQTKGVVDCAAIQRMDFSGLSEAPTSITSANVVKASGNFKEYCEVNGVIAPQISFTLRLPTESWNGRYFQAGCGGLCGDIRMDRCEVPQARDFAVAAHNMGHVGHFWSNAMWADVPELRADYGNRSTHVVAVASKAIIAAYYGQRPAKNYFQGCSTGGREGMNSAHNYPGDFDGIIAGDAAYPVRQGAIMNNWAAQILLDTQDREIFSDESKAVLHRAVLEACDKLDGVADGILSDPRLCRFDPRTTACTEGNNTNCLNEAQVQAAMAIYNGPRNSRGERLSPGGYPYGSELSWRGKGNLEVATTSLRHLVFAEPRPDFHYRDFDWDNDIAAVEAQSALLDGIPPRVAPDYAAFHARGGKMIAYHGWGDGIPPTSLLDFYQRVWEKEGGLDATREWFRVFMVPGMGHCRGGDAPNTFDLLTEIVAWVEHGQAPDGVIATQYNDDQSVKRTRPLYAYPTLQAYSGQGDVNDAANWRPAPPKSAPDDKIDWIWAPKN